MRALLETLWAGPPSVGETMKRRKFLSRVGLGTATVGLTGGTVASAQPAPARKPVLMHPGHQHDHSPETLRALAAFGVKNICSGRLGTNLDNWSVEALTRLRQQVESFGIALDCLPLPMSPREVSGAELPDLFLAREPGREQALQKICQMIRNAGAAGIPMVKYNFTFVGMVRTARVKSRG